MRCIYRCSVTIMILVLLFANGMEVKAVKTGLITDCLSEKEKDTFLANVDISLLEEEPTKKAIECFDVSKSGMIAIGQKSSQNKVVCIYSQDGRFVCGYVFNCSGAYAVEWAENDLNIFFVRSDVIATVTTEGEILDVAKVQNTIENNTYLNDNFYTTERVLGDTVYKLRNDMGILNMVSTSYSQLVAVHSTGEETILYDVNANQLIYYSIVCIMVVVLILFITVVALASYRRKQHS